MSSPTRYPTIGAAAQALAQARGVELADAREQLERWLREAGASPGATRVRRRKRSEGVDVTYHLGDEGELTGVSIRLSAGHGRGADKRHKARSRERQAERATWDERRPVVVRVSQALRDRLSRRARDERRSLAGTVLVACDAAVRYGVSSPTSARLDAEIRARIDAGDLERYRDAAQRAGLELRTWIRAALERTIGEL